jgi:predicted Zn-dependent protease
MIDVESWKWQEADEEYQTALRLDPTSVESCGCYAYFLAIMRRFPESLALVEHGAQIDPLSPVIQQVYGMSLSGAGKPAEAIPHLQRALELDPGNYTAGNFLAAIFENSGEFDDALKVLSRPQFQSSGPLARVYALLGRNREARVILQKLTAKPYPSHVDVASVYFALGEKDHAFAWLRKGADERDPFIVRMTLNPAFEGVRSDPRFQNLVARFNFPNH